MFEAWIFFLLFSSAINSFSNHSPVSSSRVFNGSVAWAGSPKWGWDFGIPIVIFTTWPLLQKVRHNLLVFIFIQIPDVSYSFGKFANISLLKKSIEISPARLNSKECEFHFKDNKNVDRKIWSLKSGKNVETYCFTSLHIKVRLPLGWASKGDVCDWHCVNFVCGA